MTESTRERVARALYGRNPLEDQPTDLDGRPVGKAGAIPWRALAEMGEYGESIMAMYLADVDAILDVLAEPSEEAEGIGAHQMTGAVNATCCHRSGGRGGPRAHPNCDCRDCAPRVWRAMLTAIREGK